MTPNVLQTFLIDQPEVAVNVPDCPIFSSFVSRPLRALRALALGCDLLPGGIMGVGIKSPLLSLDYDDLLTNLQQISPTHANVLPILVSAFLAEPPNIVDDTLLSRLNNPYTMDLYHAQMELQNKQVTRNSLRQSRPSWRNEGISSMSTFLCESGNHIALEVLDRGSCAACTRVTCKSCVSSRQLCYSCMTHIEEEIEAESVVNDSLLSMTYTDLLQKASEFHISTGSATPADTEVLCTLIRQAMTDSSHVMFQDPATLPPPVVNISGTSLYDSAILNDQVLKSSLLLLSALVDSQTTTTCKLELPVPILVDDLATKSRDKGGGGRLIRYGIRGATSALQMSYPIFVQEQGTCLRFSGNVVASMMKTSHCTAITIQFLTDEGDDCISIQSTECTCKAGVGVCHHPFVILFSCIILAYSGVGESMLSEARSRFGRDLVRIGVEPLISALFGPKQIEDVLQYLAVNTEKVKPPPPPPNDSCLKPISDIEHITSSKSRFKSTMKKPSQSQSHSPKPIFSTFDIDWLAIGAAWDIIERKYCSSSWKLTSPGFSLSTLRIASARRESLNSCGDNLDTMSVALGQQIASLLLSVLNQQSFKRKHLSENEPMKKLKKSEDASGKRCCDFVGCSAPLSSGMKCYSPITAKKPKLIEKRRKERMLILDRIGRLDLKSEDHRCIRICLSHPLDSNGIPFPIGMKELASQSTASVSKGVGLDREVVSYKRKVVSGDAGWAGGLVLDILQEQDTSSQCPSSQELETSFEKVVLSLLKPSINVFYETCFRSFGDLLQYFVLVHFQSLITYLRQSPETMAVDCQRLLLNFVICSRRLGCKNQDLAALAKLCDMSKGQVSTIIKQMSSIEEHFVVLFSITAKIFYSHYFLHRINLDLLISKRTKFLERADGRRFIQLVAVIYLLI
jgi:hypothetical protein